MATCLLARLAVSTCKRLEACLACLACPALVLAASPTSSLAIPFKPRLGGLVPWIAVAAVRSDAAEGSSRALLEPALTIDDHETSDGVWILAG
jgi:hypothetical protein